jgi:hypothetical protein
VSISCICATLPCSQCRRKMSPIPFGTARVAAPSPLSPAGPWLLSTQSLSSSAALAGMAHAMTNATRSTRESEVMSVSSSLTSDSRNSFSSLFRKPRRSWRRPGRTSVFVPCSRPPRQSWHSSLLGPSPTIIHTQTVKLSNHHLCGQGTS